MSNYDEYEDYDEDDDEFLDEEDEYEDYDEEEQETAPRKRRSGIVSSLTGGTFITTEIIGAMMHGGVLGVGAGILASAAVYLKGQDVLDLVQEIAAKNSIHLPKLKGRSLKDRIFNNFPEEESQPRLDEPIKENHVSRRHKRSLQIVLSPDLILERSEVISKSIFAVGQRRSGKTTLGAVLAEQMGQYSVPMFIPDSEGDLLSIYDLLPRGVIAAAPGSRYEDDEDINFWAVTPEDADVLGFQILYEGMQVILDMSTFEDDEAWQIVIGVIDGLFEYAKQYPDRLCPVEVFLDEAQKYLPEDLSTSAIKDAEIRDGLLEAYRDCSGTGGKRGITSVILSQRFAETNKKIMAQSEIRIIMRQTQDNDLSRCMKYVRSETATTQQIANFSKGQGVFIGEDGTQLVTRFNQRESDGSRSRTPGVEAVDRFAHRPLRLRQPERAERTIIRQDQGAEDEQPPQRAQRPATPRQEPQGAGMKQSKRGRIIQQGAQLRLEGNSQAACAEKLGLTAWTIRPFWAGIEAEAERLRELENQAEAE